MLLVEDNPADVVLLKYGLEEAEAAYDLQVAKDGEEAASILRDIKASNDIRPDLILLDLNLPKRSGHEVLAIVKADTWLRFIPVVILSSSEAPSDIMSAYGHGANSYLRKPSSLDESLDLIRTVEHYWLNLALLPAT
jgi:CheY-like chemotaxis protein